MSEFLYFLSTIWNDWIALLASVNLIVAGVTVPIFWIFVGFLIIGMLITAFWKGAKT